MKKLLTFTFAMLLTACVGTSQQSKFYTIQSMTSSTTATNSSNKLSVGVTEITIPAYLDKPQIVTTAANGVELNISEFNRWSEPLSSMLQRTLADDLGAYLPGAVVKPRTSARENFNYLLNVEINKFDGSFDKTVKLDAWWSLIDRNNQIIRRHRVDLSLPVKNSYDNMVIQQSILIGELAKNIATEIKKLK